VSRVDRGDGHSETAAFANRCGQSVSRFRVRQNLGSDAEDDQSHLTLAFNR